MIANLIGGFVAILIGTSLIGPVSVQTNSAASSTYATNTTPCATGHAGNAAYPECQLYLASSWGATVLKLVPGFFALGIMGIGVAVTYSSLRQAGIV